MMIGLIGVHPRFSWFSGFFFKDLFWNTFFFLIHALGKHEIICKQCKKTSGAMVLASTKRRNWPFKILDRESGMNKSRHPTKKHSFLAQKPRHEQNNSQKQGEPENPKANRWHGKSPVFEWRQRVRSHVVKVNVRMWKGGSNTIECTSNMITTYE